MLRFLIKRPCTLLTRAMSAVWCQPTITLQSEKIDVEWAMLSSVGPFSAASRPL
jgi:hypothetical protein